MAYTLDYYEIATITTVKSFIVQAPARVYLLTNFLDKFAQCSHSYKQFWVNSCLFKSLQNTERKKIVYENSRLLKSVNILIPEITKPTMRVNGIKHFE